MGSSDQDGTGRTAWHRRLAVPGDSQVARFAGRVRERDPDRVAFLAGRRVALVGPGLSLPGAGQRSRIDGHDWVARIDSSVLSLPLRDSARQDWGERCDLLYLDAHYARTLSRDRPGILPGALSLGLIRRLVGLEGLAPSPGAPPADTGDPFAALAPAFPDCRIGCTRAAADRVAAWLGEAAHASGLVALVDLLAHDVRELTVTGFALEDLAGADCPQNGMQVLAELEEAFRGRLALDESVSRALGRESGGRPAAPRGLAALPTAPGPL